MSANHNNHFRVVVTGGPGAGKTTAADLFRRELGEKVVIVPEAATLLFSGGFPRSDHEDASRCAQEAIYHVQKRLEDIQASLYKNRVLLCDRGTIDGAAYWKGNNDDFFESVGSSLKDELERYDAVIFFESAAVGNISIEGGNPCRTESLKEAVEIDTELRSLWQQHPHFEFIPHRNSFFEKLNLGLTALNKIVEKNLP